MIESGRFDHAPRRRWEPLDRLARDDEFRARVRARLVSDLAHVAGELIFRRQAQEIAGFLSPAPSFDADSEALFMRIWNKAISDAFTTARAVERAVAGAIDKTPDEGAETVLGEGAPPLIDELLGDCEGVEMLAEWLGGLAADALDDLGSEVRAAVKELDWRAAAAATKLPTIAGAPIPSGFAVAFRSVIVNVLTGAARQLSLLEAERERLARAGRA